MSTDKRLGFQFFETLTSAITSALNTRKDRDGAPDPEELVKLVHTRELAVAGRLPRYQDHEGISLAAFGRQRRALRDVESACKGLVEANAVLAAKDTDEQVPAGVIDITIPRSLLRGEVSVPIPRLQFATAVPVWREGRINSGRLWAQGRWFERTAQLEITCASREKHAQELATARQRVADASLAEQKALNQLQASPYRAPVLFISHRWRDTHHPDPEGETLQRLQSLGDAYLIVDYCSFPQPPFAGEQGRDLDLILEHMGHLMRNVVVLHSEDYLSRGWCVYEYLCACLKRTLVCDEIQDERYVDLHRWVCTDAPPPTDPFRDGISGSYANFIQESVLNCINRLLPQFREAKYTLDSDQVRVRRMLREELSRTLPARRKHEPLLSETLSKPWTAEELELAFDTELQWERLDSLSTQQFDVRVANSLAEGRRRRFRRTVTRSEDWETMCALSSLRSWYARSHQERSGPDLGAMDA